MILMSATVATTTPSWAILLNTNNNIKLAKKNISSNEPKVSHKFGGVSSRSVNNNVKSKSSISTKKEV